MIREAEAKDMEAMARLATQLGYPSTPEQLEARWSTLRQREDTLTLVAEEDDRVVGWTQFQILYSMTSDPYPEIYGLVVDEACRGQGIGAKLIRAGGVWAAGRGFMKLRVHTNLTRTDAHRFYERLGFVRIKEQRVYEWAIDA